MSNSKLEPQIDNIVEMILDGKTYREIAATLKCALTTLHDFTSKSEHHPRIREALEYSANTFDDQAEQVLKDAKGTLPEIQRARELAQHYRWKASKRNPARFADKIQTEHSGQVSIKQITGMEVK